MFQNPSEAQHALERERNLPLTGWQQEVSQGLAYGLEAAESIRDRTISTCSRGELPHFAGINTFLKAPYLEGDGNWRSPTKHRESRLRRSRRRIWAIAKMRAFIIETFNSQ